MNKANSQFDFDPITSRYDLCNHLFSLGIDHLWRRRTVKALNPETDQKVLDLCCGTGDLVFSFFKHSPVKTVTGLDISEPMIHLAQEKQLLYACRKWMQDKNLTWRVADAVLTGLEPESVDTITCAFGIRNVPDYDESLAEMHRVLTPSGKVGILEFSLPSAAILRGVYLLYLKNIMPVIGRFVLGKSQPLKYLADSIQKWDKIDFSASLQQTGFRRVQKTPLSCGLVTLWVAEKG